MEAMLHLLNSRSKKNQRNKGSFSTSWTLTPNMMTCYSVIGILLIGLPTLTEAYSYPYYKCAKPSNLETYDHSSLCATPANPLALGPETTWQLLQVSRSVEIEGYSCDICKSLFQGYCVVWGHTKLGGPPSVLTSYSVSREECERMIAARKFVTPHSPNGHPLTLGHPNHF